MESLGKTQMNKYKVFIKSLIPPILSSILGFLRRQTIDQETWSGNYSSWAEAQIICTGYDSKLILEKCKTALLKVKTGEAVYERDSVLFDKIHYSWPMLVGLQRAALENDGKLCVLDFGGSLGSSYYQNKGFLCSLKELTWCIVEQPNFVDCGKKYFEDDHLKFYRTIEECLAKHKPNVLLLSSVLQYLEKPYDWIEKFVGIGVTYIIIDRTSFIENEQDILTVQKVPESIYHASYPAWFFNYSNFIQSFTNSYEIISDFEDNFIKESLIMGKICTWKGLLLKIKK